MNEKDQDNAGGLHIGGNVNVTGGDFVAGDKNITVGEGGAYVGGNVEGGNIITGDQNEVVNIAAVRSSLFGNILEKIEQRPDTPPEDKEDLKASVQEIKAEAERGENADESLLARRLRNIQRMAPDIAEVVLATLANPAAGFAAVIRKVAERASKAGENPPEGAK